MTDNIFDQTAAFDPFEFTETNVGENTINAQAPPFNLRPAVLGQPMDIVMNDRQASYGTPENRLIHYKRGHLKLNMSTFQVAQPHPNGNQTIHYVYMCKKLEGADEQCELKWAEVEAEIKKEENDENAIMDDTEEEEDEERPEGQ